jgi:hypothetical protein
MFQNLPVANSQGDHSNPMHCIHHMQNNYVLSPESFLFFVFLFSFLEPLSMIRN